MGNSTGNLQDYWDVIEASRQLQGGVHLGLGGPGLPQGRRPGRHVLGVRRRLRPADVPSDQNFCCNGIVGPDRTPHPAYWEVKKVYQNIKFKALDTGAGRIEIRNGFGFLDLSRFAFDWEVFADGVPAAKGALAKVEAAPGAARSVSVPLRGIPRRPGVEYFLTLTARTRAGDAWLPAGHVVAAEQFRLPWDEAAAAPAGAPAPGLGLDDGPRETVVTGTDFRLVLDKLTGALSSFAFRGVELLERGPEPNFWRAPTDNDFGNGADRRWAPWRRASQYREIKAIEARREAADRVTLSVSFALDGVPADDTIRYTVGGDGRVLVETRLHAARRRFQAAGDAPGRGETGPALGLRKSRLVRPGPARKLRRPERLRLRRPIRNDRGGGHPLCQPAGIRHADRDAVARGPERGGLRPSFRGPAPAGVLGPAPHPGGPDPAEPRLPASVPDHPAGRHLPDPGSRPDGGRRRRFLGRPHACRIHGPAAGAMPTPS